MAVIQPVSIQLLIAFVFFALTCTFAGRLIGNYKSCAVPALTTAGWVCGALRTSYRGARYASFRGMPYAKQPLGALRFVTLQPVEPWNDFYNATIEGPACLQRDVAYGVLLQPTSFAEDCIRINVHVPLAALPSRGTGSRATRDTHCAGGDCLPVLVHIHGGGFQSGSGDSDINGPEYMIDEGVVFVTFNYRLGPFGFLSLNSSSVPGNAGLRDMITALQWVQENARAFGGDPAHVTLMGQSAGASAVHLLSLSNAAKGLFTKLILLSATAGAGFYTTLPSYAQFITSSFLTYLGINSTDVDDIHNQLIMLPYETIINASAYLQESSIFSVFNPVVETEFEGVTRVLDEDPDLLVANGRGSSYPIVLGFTNVECASFRFRLEDFDIIAKIKQNATAILPMKLIFSVSTESQQAAAAQMQQRYFNGTATMDKYIVACSDEHFIYPVLKLAEARAKNHKASTFLFQFSYSSEYTAQKQVSGLNYTGAGHLEDLTYILRVNSILGNSTLNTNDESVKDWMSSIVSNYTKYSTPTRAANKAGWPKLAGAVRYQDIRGAVYAMSALTTEQHSMIELFDSFYDFNTTTTNFLY